MSTHTAPTPPPQADAGSLTQAVVDREQFRRDEDFILRQWQEVTIGDWRTKLLDIGQGEPLLIVPIAQHLEVFESRLIQHFARAHRVLFFQRRESPTNDLRVLDRAIDIKRVLDYLGLQRVHLVAHSSGAAAALFFVIAHQEHVQSFVLQSLSPVVTIPPLDSFLATYLTRYAPLPRRVFLDLLTSRCAARGTPEYDLVYGQWSKYPDIQQFWNHSIWTMARYDARPYLSGIRVPVLVIGSDDDAVNGLPAMRYFHEHLPNSHGLKVVSGGQHFFHYWKVDQVIPHIEAFYGELAFRESAQPAPESRPDAAR